MLRMFYFNSMQFWTEIWFTNFWFCLVLIDAFSLIFIFSHWILFYFCSFCLFVCFLSMFVITSFVSINFERRYKFWFPRKARHFSFYILLCILTIVLFFSKKMDTFVNKNWTKIRNIINGNFWIWFLFFGVFFYSWGWCKCAQIFVVCLVVCVSFPHQL